MTPGRSMTLPEIWRAGIEALMERLGPAGMLQFLQLIDPGHGDYTKDRHAWLDDLTIDDVARSVEARRKKP